MTTAATPQTSPLDHLAHEHEDRAQQCVRALHAPGSEERLAALATQMTAQGVVRAPGVACRPVRHLDLELLREALVSLLRRKRDAASLIIQLVVEGMEPDLVATERGVSRPVLVNELRRAVGALAGQYEILANDHLNERPALSISSAPEGKSG